MKLMIMLLVLAMVVALDVWVFIRLVIAFRRLRVPVAKDGKSDDMPTVTICIPARNETHAMTQCLERVVASDYPKLEVIVLDDGSRDDTSILIKSFAHAGVRFIEGKQLPEGWLGKNYAQSVLAREASGQLVFFIDVDTMIDRHTVSRLVSLVLQENIKMASIIPMRNDHWMTSTLFTTMRHFWAMMRHTPRQPRATSNAWVIERSLLLDQFDHDTTLPLSMKVETSIARKLAATNDYRLFLSNKWLGIRFEKRWSSQVETSIRVLYPQCHYHWYEALLLIGLLCIALLPYAAVFFTVWAWLVIILQYLIALYYISHVWSRYRLFGAALLPVTISQELVLLFMSAYRYTFGTVTWKGRSIKLTRAS